MINLRKGTKVLANVTQVPNSTVIFKDWLQIGITKTTHECLDAVNIMVLSRRAMFMGPTVHSRIKTLDVGILVLYINIEVRAAEHNSLVE